MLRPSSATPRGARCTHYRSAAVSDVLDEAQRLYQESLDALRDQRTQIEDDLRFSDPSNPQQWDEAVKRERESDPGGARPCLVMDQCSQYVQQVTGQIEQQPPSLHAIPVGGGADKKAAEQIDGRFRHIEHASRATQHYARAMTSAARAGVGYLTVRPEYVDRALGWQEPRIGSEPDPLKVILDPWSVDTDGKDADFGFILSDMSERNFKRRWPKAEIKDFGDTESQRQADERKNVLVAEMWEREWVQTAMIVYRDERGEEVSGQADEAEAITARLAQAGMPLEVVREYREKAARIWWRRMNGAEVLEDSEYWADSIGIVPVYGYVGFADGRMKYCGIPRRARGPQQAYNFHKSELMMPGATLVASFRAMAGVEKLWENAQTERRGVMPYHDQDEMGPVSAPTLLKTGSSLVDHFQGAESALRDLQASVAMFQANLGAPSNETSGVAIESRKEQGEAGNAHFPSHMAASLGQVGAIVMQMDARLTDKRRTMPILGVDGSPGQITVDPGASKSFERLPKGGVVINPNLGTYAVRVVVGASYSTQRTQTNAAFAEIMRGNKELAPTVAPFWAQTLDFPGSDKFAQAMAAMAPAPVKALLQPEGADDELDPADMAQQLAQCKEALQEAIQHAEAAQADADEAMREADIQKTKALARDKELEIAEYEAETKRLQVTGANEQQIQAITSELVNEILEGAMPQVQALAQQSAEQGATGVLTAAQQAQEQERMAREAQGDEDDAMEKQALDALMQGQAQIAQRMQQLIQLVAMERERIPERGPDGSITRVIDRMMQRQPDQESMQ